MPSKQHALITIRNKTFEVYISSEEIEESIAQVANQISSDYEGEIPVFLGVMNGAFMFVSDLLKRIEGECEVGFVKASSYQGMQSTGKVAFKETSHLPIKGRHVIVVEDIVDTGNTLKALYEHFDGMQPKSIKVCTLLFKKQAYKQSLPIDYVCFETENKFLLGYGLDYDGLGRNLPEVYILKD